MSSSKAISDKNKARQWEVFKSNVQDRGVYLIFEKLYIFPGETIPEKFGPDLTPHYRLISREERRLKKRGTLR